MPMPGIPPPMPIAGASPSGFGISVITASVVKNIPAAEAAFCRAVAFLED